MGADEKVGGGSEVNRKYSDGDVCRLFLSGLCPYDLFQSTRLDSGSCPKVHSVRLRKEYEEAKAKEMVNYDRDLLNVLRKLVLECQMKIKRTLQLLTETDAEAATEISVEMVTQKSEVVELSKKIKEKLKEADEFDLEGNRDLKNQILEEVEELRTKRADKEAVLLFDAFCEVRASLPGPLPDPPALELQPLDAHISEKENKIEDLCEEGLFDEASELELELSELHKEELESNKDSTEYFATVVFKDHKTPRACDICGAFLSVYYSDRLLAEHFRQKLHQSYMLIREKLSELVGLTSIVHTLYFRDESRKKLKSKKLKRKRLESIGLKSKKSKSKKLKSKKWKSKELMSIMLDCLCFEEGLYFFQVPPNKKRKICEDDTSYATPEVSCGISCSYATPEVTYTIPNYAPWPSIEKEIGKLFTNKEPYNRYAYSMAKDWTYVVRAAFSSSSENQAYVILGVEYAVVDYVKGEVVEGPRGICCGFKSLKRTIFKNGMDCAFRCKDTTEAFLFCRQYCVKINFAPHTGGGGSIINPPDDIERMFPCLTGSGVENFLDAAFESPVHCEAYLFKGSRYAHISFGVDKKLIATGTIAEGFPCLRRTRFKSGVGAAFTCHLSQQVYLFKEEYYAVIAFTPGGFRMIGSVKKILPNLACFRKILPYPKGSFDFCPTCDPYESDEDM